VGEVKAGSVEKVEMEETWPPGSLGHAFQRYKGAGVFVGSQSLLIGGLDFSTAGRSGGFCRSPLGRRYVAFVA
jgi:hypothetical protein